MYVYTYIYIYQYIYVYIELTLYKICVHFKVCVHESIILCCSSLTCGVNTFAMHLHDYCAVTPPLHPSFVWYTLSNIGHGNIREVSNHVEAVCIHGYIHTCIRT